jgi:hypothetical protein
VIEKINGEEQTNILMKEFLLTNVERIRELETSP